MKGKIGVDRSEELKNNWRGKRFRKLKSDKTETKVNIGVNAAGVAGVAGVRTPQYLTCRGPSTLVPGTVSEGLNGWSEALTAGLAVKTAKPLS